MREDDEIQNTYVILNVEGKFFSMGKNRNGRLHGLFSSEFPDAKVFIHEDEALKTAHDLYWPDGKRMEVVANYGMDNEAVVGTYA